MTARVLSIVESDWRLSNRRRIVKDRVAGCWRSEIVNENASAADVPRAQRQVVKICFLVLSFNGDSVSRVQ